MLSWSYCAGGGRGAVTAARKQRTYVNSSTATDHTEFDRSCGFAPPPQGRPSAPTGCVGGARHARTCSFHQRANAHSMLAMPCAPVGVITFAGGRTGAPTDVVSVPSIAATDQAGRAIRWASKR
eukprot:NODE_22039_length_725_cov_3.874582.p3 GENE.NODE_22039_length_725_cov_3.874582~~NODE_22039_length_725_cov_3.874582.p3  ORF type:complete len:124 (-),score=16.10 NODE_22039_length_725_cov_3.874582:112-483(-)